MRSDGFRCCSACRYASVDLRQCRSDKKMLGEGRRQLDCLMQQPSVSNSSRNQMTSCSSLSLSTAASTRNPVAPGELACSWLSRVRCDTPPDEMASAVKASSVKPADTNGQPRCWLTTNRHRWFRNSMNSKTFSWSEIGFETQHCCTDFALRLCTVSATMIQRDNKRQSKITSGTP